MRATDPSSPEQHRLSRRAIVKGAAWSVPVIAAAAAVPQAAASTTPARQTYTVTATGAGSAQGYVTFRLPADATNILYTVVGGNGAGSTGTAGGRGAHLSGMASTPPAEIVVTLLAAGGGITGSPNSSNTRVGQGGAGYGAGGSTPAAPATAPPADHQFFLSNGGGGGGGSALQFGSELAVVAGGGGGAGQLDGRLDGSGALSVPQYAKGGDADTTAATARVRFDEGPEERTLTATGGASGTATTGGAGGVGSTFEYYEPADRTADGLPGTDAPGGNGGNALSWMVSGSTTTTKHYALAGTSGGGGGGYAGGGSGSTAIGSRHLGHLAGVGSGGGGGSSYTTAQAGGLVLTPAFAGLHPTSPTAGANGAAGEVTVTFEAAAGLTFP